MKGKKRRQTLDVWLVHWMENKTTFSESSRKRTPSGGRTVSATGAGRLRECVNTEFV